MKQYSIPTPIKFPAVVPLICFFSLFLGGLTSRGAAIEIAANEVAEISFHAAKPHPDPFKKVNLDVVFTNPKGVQETVPAFWDGGDLWKVRYASPLPGQHRYQSRCDDMEDTGLNGIQGTVEIKPYSGQNPLYQHGPVTIAADHRHFMQADGTPFFWLGDTWWKELSKRMTWEGFQELEADRQNKGFSVIQIVAGPYPDQPPFDPRWENEGGMPYEPNYRNVNPKYFDYADQRIKSLVDHGLVPAIVGGWGWHMPSIGVETMNRHWRYLIARYGAYPVVWVIGGEAFGPQWTQVARFVHETDPFQRPATIHPPVNPFDSGRKSVTDESVLSFDMLQTGHGDWPAALGAIPRLNAAYKRQPPMPALIGEACYEEHMQTAFQDVQRYVFWSSILSGAAGHTYGAAGVWHASVEGDPGITPVYDLTTWREGMNFPGSTELGLGKKLLEQYPWWRFEPHQEWVGGKNFAAGIPGEVRLIYAPRRNVYDWQGPPVKNLEPGIPYAAFYFNPVNGKRYDRGEVINLGEAPKLDLHPKSILLEDEFPENDLAAWKDYGTPTHREGGHLAGGKGMLTILEQITDANLMASADARSDAEAGIVLRFHTPSDYLVALYSPSLKKLFIHDRKNGQWGPELGAVPVPEIGPRIRITAAASDEFVAAALTDGTHTYLTPIVSVKNVMPGKTGLWLFQIGERQEFDNFQVAHSPLPHLRRKHEDRHIIWSGQDYAPTAPSPQDWVLVLQRVKK